MHPLHPNIQPIITKPISSMIDQIPNQITNGKISNNINNNFNTFNINNIFKNILPKKVSNVNENGEAKREIQKTSRLKSKKKKINLGHLASKREVAKHPQTKNYFYRVKQEERKSKVAVKKKKKKATSQLNQKKRSRSKRKMNYSKKTRNLKKTDSLQANLETVEGEEKGEEVTEKEKRERETEKHEDRLANLLSSNRKRENLKKNSKTKKKISRNQSKIVRKLKKAKSIEKIYLKGNLEREMSSEQKFQSYNVLLKAHKSIPNLKHFTERKKNRKKRKQASFRPKKTGKSKALRKSKNVIELRKPKTNFDNFERKIKRTLSKKKILKANHTSKSKFKILKNKETKLENDQKRNPELILFQKKSSKKLTHDLTKEKRKLEGSSREEEKRKHFYETVDEIHFNKESLIEKVKKLKFSELPKKSLRKKDKRKVVMKPNFSKVKFALESSYKNQEKKNGGNITGKEKSDLREKAKKLEKKASQGSLVKQEQRSRSGQKVLYLKKKSKGKNKGGVSNTQREKNAQT